MIGIIPALSALVGFLVSWLLGLPVIPMLKRLKFGQTIREDGPDWHKTKQGTPTMGGVLIVAGLAVAVCFGFGVSLFFNEGFMLQLNTSVEFTKIFAGLGLAIGMGLIGFFDDYIKVVKKRNLGLTAWQKTLFQSLVTAGYLISLVLAGVKTTYIPFIGEINVVTGMGFLFWPIAFFFVYGFTNAVNLTDGIDGLASSVTLVVATSFMLMSGMMHSFGANIIAASLAGALIGFLVWNWHRAKLFMGDTGSMFLGGAVVALSFCIDRPVLLILAGVIYLTEALSVVLQVASFKLTGKRIFKMSPIHHHFEKSGWSEVKIVAIFSLVTLIGCSIAVMIMNS